MSNRELGHCFRQAGTPYDEWLTRKQIKCALGFIKDREGRSVTSMERADPSLDLHPDQYEAWKQDHGFNMHVPAAHAVYCGAFWATHDGQPDAGWRDSDTLIDHTAEMAVFAVFTDPVIAVEDQGVIVIVGPPRQAAPLEKR